MRVLCIFAHPDDESAGIGGTVLQLTKAGHEVHIVSATDGNGGECMDKAQDNLKKHRNHLGSLRREEFSRACSILGATCEVLEFEDGGITNQMVWGKLTARMIEVIDAYKPDVLITFDHTGWYYHLDHVAVSIATTLAAQQSQHQDFAFFLVHLRMSSERWRYIFPEVLPTTHSVSVGSVVTEKRAALDAHESQNLDAVKQRLEKDELLQLVWCQNEEARQFIESETLFKPME